ncbi:3-oxo-tetronate 4-phosphate decarboxylase [Sphingomonas profundi]|uniref:3-oxo-tetronate 4-phosphate decarboxylase n=1 Tax=Alterirhizorhabdus profundi TaxID=2681549 RepID=UPI0012E92DCF|nr:3-oxo-tetronate 4-phosphate decarboxylase [Sphingomonas profundi]
MTGADPIAQARAEIVRHGRSLFERGLATGSSGNLSILLDDGSMLLTPTDASLGGLEPDRIAHVTAEGAHVSGDLPSKEAFLHRAIYAARPHARGVVHLHATHSAAVSCMDGLDASDCLPPLTAYQVMKIGRLPLIPYHPPGDRSLAGRIAAIAVDHPAVLLANHGPIVAGASLRQAMNAIEELEESAKLFLLLRGVPTRPLDAGQIADLETRFGRANDR